MSTDQFVGRVGGLAAALGVGVVIWLAVPVASADDTTGGGSSTSQSSTSERTADSPRSDEGVGASRERIRQIGQAHKKRREERASVSARAAADDSGISTRSIAESRQSPGLSRRGDSAGEPTPVSESVRVARSVAPSEPERPWNDGNSGGSVVSPMSWVVAAAARRELGGVGAAQQEAATTAGVTVVGRVTRTGHQTTSAEFNADGSRAVLTTSSLNLWTNAVTTRVSVFDTNTGRQIGRTQTTTGAAGLDTPTIALEDESSSVLNPAGTRSLITTGVTDSTTGAKTTRVTVIDTATGGQVGQVTSLAGEMWPGPVLFGADGDHALITTSTYDGRTSTNTMLYSTIDTNTGFKTGTTLALTGLPLASPVLSNDRKHVVFTTYGGEANTYTTRLGVIDTTNGTQVGTTLAFSSLGGWYSPVFSDDGSRVVILTSASQPPRSVSTSASVVSTITGAQIGKTLTFPGGGKAVLSADGAHALIIADTINWLSLTTTTRVSILRIA